MKILGIGHGLIGTGPKVFSPVVMWNARLALYQLPQVKYALCLGRWVGLCPSSVMLPKLPLLIKYGLNKMVVF